MTAISILTPQGKRAWRETRNRFGRLHDVQPAEPMQILTVKTTRAFLSQTLKLKSKIRNHTVHVELPKVHFQTRAHSLETERLPPILVIFCDTIQAYDQLIQTIEVAWITGTIPIGEREALLRSAQGRFFATLNHRINKQLLES